jgi:putative transcriptional regulator
LEKLSQLEKYKHLQYNNMRYNVAEGSGCLHSLKYFRRRAKLTQCQLAKKTGLSQAYINELENGRKSNPSFFVLAKLANALEIPAADLFTDDQKVV